MTTGPTVRWFLTIGWMLAAVGFYGPWIGHATAALTLSGSDMAEFVKFLPGVLDGSLRMYRQAFYLPPLAVVTGIALLVQSPALGFPRLLRPALLLAAIPVSLQLLPPAWSPASLMTPEFRLQPAAIVLCWLLLAACRLLGRLPLQATGSLAGVVALAAGTAALSQLLTAKPAIDAVYGRPPAMGWGVWTCLSGLMLLALAGGWLGWRTRRTNRAIGHAGSIQSTPAG